MLNETVGRSFPLSRGEVACWYSHIRMLQEFVTAPGDPESLLVLEDDVDVELDLRNQIRQVQAVLPSTYDMVCLITRRSMMR